MNTIKFHRLLVYKASKARFHHVSQIFQDGPHFICSVPNPDDMVHTVPGHTVQLWVRKKMVSVSMCQTSVVGVLMVKKAMEKEWARCRVTRWRREPKDVSSMEYTR